MHVTMRQIADEVGVSRVAVSYVVNGREDQVSLDTCRRIREALQRHDYQPNALVRSIQQQRTGVIGVIVPSISASLYHDVVNELETKARACGFQCLLCQHHSSTQILAESVSTFRQHRVDGMLIYACNSIEQADLYQGLLQHKVPFVLMGHQVLGVDAPLVANDNVQCGYLATQHLLKLGHHRIGFIKGYRDSFVARDRFAGYRKALTQAGIAFEENDAIEDCDYGDGKPFGIAKLLDRPSPLTGIVAYNDGLAADFVDELQRRNIRIPEDVSIVGCGNMDFGTRMRPMLTTINQNPKQIGTHALRLLTQRMHEVSCPSQNVLVEPELIVRQSTGSKA